MKIKVKQTHSLQWVYDQLQNESTFLQKKLFGCEAAYLHGLLMAALAEGKEPWNGLLICTSLGHHASLKKQYPRLRSHTVLRKWLYISQKDPHFEEVAASLVQDMIQRDPRIGVESKRKVKTP